MLLGAALLAAQLGFAGALSDARWDRISEEVRRKLVTLPYYSLFDNFTYRVDGNTVTLMGEVTQPKLKSDAEAAVKNIEGVEVVRNEVAVLPLSAHDDELRLALYNTIYGAGPLQTLSVRAVPPVHIIVKNGHVTLEGVVPGEFHKTLAGTRANSVPGVFSVTNNLRVESKS